VISMTDINARPFSIFRPPQASALLFPEQLYDMRTANLDNMGPERQSRIRVMCLMCFRRCTRGPRCSGSCCRRSRRRSCRGTLDAYIRKGEAINQLLGQVDLGLNAAEDSPTDLSRARAVSSPPDLEEIPQIFSGVRARETTTLVS
jgi:hypothetical protein